MQQLVRRLQLAGERVDSVGGPGCVRRSGFPASGLVTEQCGHGAGTGARITLGDHHRLLAVMLDALQAVGIRGDDWSARRRRLECGERSTLPRQGKRHHIECGGWTGHIAHVAGAPDSVPQSRGALRAIPDRPPARPHPRCGSVRPARRPAQSGLRRRGADFPARASAW